MESPGRLGLSRALVACALLVAPAAAAGRPSWRDAHSSHDTPASQGSHHAAPSSAPRPVRSEVGVPVSEREPVLWTLIPSPFMEEMQILASKGDTYATLAPQKWDAWRAWKATFRPGKQYESVGTEVQAFRAFIENDQVIATHNADHASSYYSLGHSEWSATSFHEFESLMFPVKTQDIMPPVHSSSGVHGYLDAEGKPKPIPDRVDWTEEGAVSPVGNQGECGSSWAFASTGAIEGVCSIHGHTANGVGPLPLSAQELVSCDVGTLDAPYADDGCDGGLPQNAFGYAKTTGGLCTEAEYEYVSGNGHSYPCTHCTKRLSVGGYMTLEAGNEAALMHAVAQQPIAVAIQANSMQLQLYRSGVFDSPSCGKEPDHAVLLVGYGTTSTNVPYWKVKNSWGTSWGDGGYFYLKRGVNQCGITTMASYPINCAPFNGGDPRGKPLEALPDPAKCPAPRDGDIKLTSYPAGNLLIHFEGAFHPLCSQHLEIETAELMCKALGYSTAWSFSDRTIPTQDTGPMFPSLHCDKSAKGLSHSQLGGANVLDMCTFKSAHTSDWLCELFGPSMAAYLVCFGTTPPQAVQTCGTAAWPNRKHGQGTEAAQAATALMRERLAASATRPAARNALALFAAAATAAVGVLAIAGLTISRAYRQQRKDDDLL